MGMAFVSAPVSEAEAIAREIVLRKLAACAQVTSPISSIYWWIHPYELPELTFVPITDGSDEYLPGWRRSSNEPTYTF